MAAGSPVLRHAVAALGLLLLAGALAGETVHRRELPSGVVVVVRDHQVSHAAEVAVLLRGGPIAEGDLLGHGASELARRLLHERILRLAPQQGAAGLALGDGLRSDLLPAAIRLSLTTTDAQVTDALRLLGAALAPAEIAAADLDRHRAALIADLARDLADPVAIERQALRGAVLRVHPARLPSAGRPDLVRDLPLASLQAHLARITAAPNLVVVVVGHVPAALVEDEVAAATVALPAWGWNRPAVPAEPVQTQPRGSVLSVPGLAAPRRAYAWRALPLDAADQPAQAVLAALLDHPRHSPLRQALEAGGLARDLSVRLVADPGCPAWLAVAFAPVPRSEGDAWQAGQEALARLERDGPGSEALQAAKLALRRDLAGRRSQVRGLADDLACWELALGEPAQGERLLAALPGVTADDVRRVAATVLRSERRTVVSLSPRPVTAPAGIQAGPLLADVPPRLTTLPCGVRIVHRPLPTGLVHLHLALGGGRSALREPAGVADLLARSYLRGGDRPGPALGQELAATGMSVETRAGARAIGLSLTCFPEDIERALEILVGQVRPPSREAAQAAALRAELVAAHSNGGEPEDDPLPRLAARLREILLAGHDEAPPLITRESLDAITPSLLDEAHRRLAVTGNLVVSLVGDYDPAVADARLTALFTGRDALPAGPAIPAAVQPWAEAPPGVTGLRSTDDRGGLAMAWRCGGPEERQGQEAALAMLSALLGGTDGTSGRLGRALQGKVRALHVAGEVHPGRGWLAVLATCVDADVEAVRLAIRSALDELAAQLALPPTDRNALPETELQAARVLCLARHTRSQEDLAALAAAQSGAVLGYHDPAILDDPRRPLINVERAVLADLAKRLVTDPPVAVLLGRAPEKAAPPAPPPGPAPASPPAPPVLPVPAPVTPAPPTVPPAPPPAAPSAPAPASP